MSAIDIFDGRWLEFAKSRARTEVRRQQYLSEDHAHDIAMTSLKKLRGRVLAGGVENIEALLTTTVQREASDMNERESNFADRHMRIGSAEHSNVSPSSQAHRVDPEQLIRRDEANRRQALALELLSVVLEDRDRALLHGRNRDYRRFADLADELGYASAQVAENRYRSIRDQGAVIAEVLHQMPDQHWPFVVESVRLAQGQVELNVEKASAHLARMQRKHPYASVRIGVMLSNANDAVAPRRGRPGLDHHVARQLVAGAAHYVHRIDDVHPDVDAENGLRDDWDVVHSVCRALKVDIGYPSKTLPASLGEFLD